MSAAGDAIKLLGNEEVATTSFRVIRGLWDIAAEKALADGDGTKQQQIDEFRALIKEAQWLLKHPQREGS